MLAVWKGEFEEEEDRHEIDEFPQSVVGSIVKIGTLKKEHKKLIEVHEQKEKMTKRQRKTIA